MNDCILELKNVSFSYKKGVEVLKDISFNLHKKEIVAVIGRNGAGKSSLFNIIAGFEKNIIGDVFLNAKNIKRLKTKEKAKLLAYIPQFVGEIPSFYSVRDYIIEGRRPFSTLGFYNENDRKIVDEIIEKLELNNIAEKNIKEISGGELQKCFLAQIMAQRPKVLLCDEPCSALDIQYQKTFFNGIYSLASELSTGVLISIHDINLAFRYCTKVIILHDKKIIFYGDVDKVPIKTLSLAFGVEIKKEKPLEWQRCVYY